MTTNYVYTAKDYQVIAIISKSGYDDGIVVNARWQPLSNAPELDRPVTFGINCGTNEKLARRVAACFDAQDGFQNITLTKDVDGKTYISGGCKLYGRQLNADLKRLGY